MNGISAHYRKEKGVLQMDSVVPGTGKQVVLFFIPCIAGG